MTHSDTIAALATAQGKSALALLRISGDDAFAVLSRCIQETNRFRKTPPRSIRLYTLMHPDSKKAIDEVTAIKYKRPSSFTGEDMVELICHGGQLVIKEVIAAILFAGARIAVRGEFTRRAFLNGKIDLLKAEAIRAMIESRCDAELKCARKLYSTTAREPLEWRSKLMEILTTIETKIEFEEEDPLQENQVKGEEEIDLLLTKIEDDLHKREQIKLYEAGIKIVIAGPVNAGKSTLFNSLLGFQRSIVHCEPGTTRDLVSERIWIKGNEVIVIDSAGFRDTMQDIEKEGINRAYKAIEASEIILWVTAADEALSEFEKEKIRYYADRAILGIINKIDVATGEEKAALFKNANIETVRVSLKTQDGVKSIFSTISKKVSQIADKIDPPDILLNSRQEELGKALKKELIKAKESWGQPEIVSYYLKNGIVLFDQLLGKTTTEEILNKIFDSFCIGK